MDRNFNNELAALERAINRLENKVVRLQGETFDNGVQEALAELIASCGLMTDEKIRFRTILMRAGLGGPENDVQP